MAVRAIVWLCWGERFIREAAASARSAGAIDADRILITDAAGAALATNHPDFTSIVPIELVHANNLEKSRLIDVLPAGYDTYLFLDSDTRIVADVTLGFAKADRHGIAMAPAPNYNLPEFFNFARIMKHVGVEPADQIMYNSGVFFFHLTPTVRAVLERWRDLSNDLGAKFDFPRDQPFLTLALEQLGVTPYVLSPLYNYRSLGEYAVGNVRIWHSHFEPPAELNAFDNAWPARRYRSGLLLPADADPEPRLPQGMLQLTFSRFIERHTSAEAQSIAADTEAIARRQGNRRANDHLLSQIGMFGSIDKDEAYFAECLHYHLGLLHAYALDPQQMADHLQRSRTMPTGEDDQLFSDHINLSHMLRAQQIAAIDRGMPALLLACMPRSASATLTYTLGRALGIPVLHLSAGRFPNYFLVPPWLDMFLEGGGITQDHFGASDFNIGVLRARGPRDIFVLVRDPRAAARSQAHYLARDGGDGGDPLSLRIERHCIGSFIPWLQGWIDCARNPDLPFRIHWLTFREVCDDPAAVLRRISAALAEDHPAMAPFADCRSLDEVRVHFVEGNDDAWQREVDYEARERLWAACTPEIKSLLGLRW